MHAVELLAAAGCRVHVIGVAHAGDPLTMPARAGVSLELMPPSSGRWTKRAHYTIYLLRVLAHAARWRPEWIYASDPLSCPAALCLAGLSRVRLVYHEHDAPDEGTGAGSLFWRTVLRARQSVSRRADVCVVPGEARGRAFSVSTGRQDPLSIWNTPTLRELAADAPPPVDGVLRVVYHGSIVPARVPVTVLDALAALPDGVTLTLIGYETIGHAGHPRALRARADALGLGSRVTMLGPQSRADLMASCARFDAGLALLPTLTPDGNEASMVGPSNKPFDYMACGLPVVVPDRPEWRAAFVDPGFGVPAAAESAPAIAEALRWLLVHPDERRIMGRRNLAQIRERWNYDTGFAPLLDRIARGSGAAELLASGAGRV